MFKEPYAKKDSKRHIHFLLVKNPVASLLAYKVSLHKACINGNLTID